MEFKKFKLVLLLLFISYSAQAQLNWVQNLDQGKKLAEKEGKLLILDFWAIWCGPCKSMDKGLWNTPQMQELSEKFVMVKIDIDRDPQVARSYGISSIPRVMVMTPQNDRLVDVTGYGGGAPFFKKFEAMPSDLSMIMNELAYFDEDETPANRFDVAVAYQLTAQEITDPRTRTSFLEISNKHFKKVLKESDNIELEQFTQMNLALNAAIRGSDKKAIKMMSKAKLDMENPDISDFANYVIAYCYDCQGNEQKVEELKAEIKNERLIASLENN